MKKIASLITGSLSLLLTTAVMAKTITLYDQPQVNAKNIGTLDSANGIIVIYTPKEAGWIKIADPKNGNVGWAKTSDLGNIGINFNVIHTDNQGGQNYQFVQFGTSTPYSQAQLQQMVQQMQQRQQLMQQNMQHMMQDMYQWINNVPMIMPVLVVPQPVTTNPTVPRSPTQQPIPPHPTPHGPVKATQ